MDSNTSAESTSTETVKSTNDDFINIDLFAKVQLRVAKIESAEMVPKSKKLIKLQVDLGPKIGKRQILSGVAQYYTPESLIGKRIVVVANLQPATLMGETSQGMLLAASNEDGNALCILEPAENIELGATVR
jgi:methionyl-tRNA synthetase